MNGDIEYSDRYTALGIKPSGCDGPCEGTGWVPVDQPEAVAHRAGDCGDAEADELARRYWDAEKVSQSRDGWHFVPCPTCVPPYHMNPS